MVLRWSLDGRKMVLVNKMVFVGLENFLFLKKKNFVWYAHGIRREDGSKCKIKKFCVLRGWCRVVCLAR